VARTTLAFDSATPAQVYNLTLAYQRTLGFALPQQITREPTVTVAGSAMGWASPALYSDHAAALLAEYHRLEAGTPDERD
jgi:hypothetical protein